MTKGKPLIISIATARSWKWKKPLTGWLRSEITRIEQQLAKLTDPLLEQRVEFSKLAEA